MKREKGDVVHFIHFTDDLSFDNFGQRPYLFYILKKNNFQSILDGD